MKKRSVITLIVVFALIIAFSGYYLVHQRELGRRGNLVGEGICGNYVKEADRDGCCATVHAEDVIEECEGAWEYLSGTESCQFVCEGENPTCPNDVKICGNETTVERNSSNECWFDSCEVM